MTHGFGISIFRSNFRRFTWNSSENEPKQGVTKNWSFSGHGPTPENSNIFFSGLYQCWLNCQKIFSGGNPWPVNNVRLFTQNCILVKMSQKLYIFIFFSWSRMGVHQQKMFSFSTFSYHRPYPKDLKIVYILCAQRALLSAHESNFIAKMTDYG